MPADPEFIPFAKPDVGEAETRSMMEALASGWLTMGPKTLAFEKAFAESVGAEDAVAVNSCTAALHLALAMKRLAPTDEVVTSTLTFAASGNVIEHAHARPVFADVDPETWNVTPQTVRAVATDRTKVLLPVHYAGLAVDRDGFEQLAAELGAEIVEDAAHAAGTRHHDAPIGRHGRAVCFSFYANKNMTTGEGGMLTTSDPEVAAKARELRLHGMSKGAWNRYAQGGSWRYDITVAGFKCNLTDPAAALGLVQLQRLESFIARRAELVARYREHLSGLRGLRFQQSADANAGDRHANHLMVVRLDQDQGAPLREMVIDALKAANIGFSVHFLPLHLMSHYRERWGYQPGSLPMAEKLGEELLSLPLFTEMTDDQVDRVCEVVLAVRA